MRPATNMSSNSAAPEHSAKHRPEHPPTYVEIAAPAEPAGALESDGYQRQLAEGRKLPPFPDRTVLDEVLYEYLRRADKMGWSPYDLVDSESMKNLARPDRLSETQLSAATIR